MRCKKCGAECPDKATFCSNCGEKLAGQDRKKLLMGAIVFVLIVAGARTVGNELFAPKRQKPSTLDIAITLGDIDNEMLRSYLSDMVDSDSDGLISGDEANRVTSFGEVDDSGVVTDEGVSGMGLDDVGFISSFKNLETLVCEDNELDQIDLSRNPAIKVLCCRGNNLTSLSVPKTLNCLYAADNPITKIDLSGCDSLEKVEVDDSVEVSAASYAPSEDEYAKASALVCTYIVSHDPVGKLAEKGALPSAGDPEVDSIMIAEALYPELGLYGLCYRDSTGEIGDLPNYAVKALGLKEDKEKGVICYPTDDDVKRILSSFYGACVPADISYLDAYKTDGVWSFPVVTAVDRDVVSLSDFEKYGDHMRVRATIRFGEGGDADPNEELWTDRTYDVLLAENPDSIYGFSFERATWLESNHHEPEIELSDLTGHYLLNPTVEADVTIEDGVVTIAGPLDYYESESQTKPTATLPRDVYTFRYAEDCVFEGCDAGGCESITRDEFEYALREKNRTLLAFVVEHGVIYTGTVIP